MIPTVTITGVFLGVMALAVPVAGFVVDMAFRLFGV
jgi:hypothetical protein